MSDDFVSLRQATHRPRERPTVEGCRRASRAGVISAATLLSRPPPARRWLIRDLIPMRATTLFSAHGGDGKSLLALQLALAVASGGKWLGYEIAEPGRVGLISCEDDTDEMHVRLSDIVGAEGISPAPLQDIDLWDRVGVESFLTKQGPYGVPEATDFSGNVENWIVDGEIKLLILDSLYNFMSGNQNDWSVAQFFMNTVNGLARDADCAVLILAHPSQSGRASGEGGAGALAFHNACRGRLYMERERAEDGQDTGVRIIRTKKANRGPGSEEIRCRWQDGRFVPDVAGGAGGFVDAIERRTRDEMARSVFMACMVDLAQQGRKVGLTPVAPNYAVREALTLSRAKGWKRKELETAMHVLLEEGELCLTEEGPPSKRRTYLVLRPEIEAGKGRLF